MTKVSPNVPGGDDASAAFAPLEPLLQRARLTAVPEARYPLLRLALRTALHPALAAHRADPLLPIQGRFVSLDVQVAALTAAVTTASPEQQIGAIGGALYLPGIKRAEACSVTVAYLAPLSGASGLDRWPDPIAVHPVAPDVADAARDALSAALHVLIYVAPGAAPPVPAPLYFSIEGDNLTGETIAATAGDSLGVPLALAFLSALTGIPIPGGVGATGAIRAPDRVATVGYIPEKRAAFRKRYGDSARFLTPDSANNLTAVAALVEADTWEKRFVPIATASDTIAPITGTPTFLWAEIENAATLWQTQTAAFRAALDSYETLLREVIGRHGGQLFAVRAGPGEAFGAAFADATAACHAGIAALRSVRAVLWPTAFGKTLPVRIGLHRGEADRLTDGWRGVGPSGAACIASAASGGQLLATTVVHSAVGEETGLSWTPLGSYRLRDLAEAMELWQVSADGLPTTFMPPQSLDTRRHNLPTYDTPLIGRDAEVTALLPLLQTHRLVTLTGSGGVGKTRLALTVAAAALTESTIAASFEDGAFFIPLDSTEATEMAIAAAITEAAQVPLPQTVTAEGTDAGKALATALARRHLLIVLDNAETAMQALAPLVQELLVGAPGVVMLVTSRAPLRLPEERRFPVAPLACPQEDDGEVAWRESAAIQLFLSRARVADGRFAVTTESTRRTVTRLCHRLDGLPLAIELAAARTRQLALTEIESRLSESFRLLTSRQTDIPERQRTLTATIEWSYGLLVPEERALLRRVSVFAGGFTAEAAEAIAEAGGETLESLESLEEQSLIVCRRTAPGEPPRFSLLQTVADFAAAKLAEAGEATKKTVLSAHARYFVGYSERYGDEEVTGSASEVDAFDALDREMANLRVAWTFLGTTDQKAQAVFTANLVDFLRRRGHAREWFLWVQTALEQDVIPGAVRARLHSGRALILRDIGKTEEADREAQALLALGEATGDQNWIAEALALRGVIATRTRQFAVAEAFFDRALLLCRETQNTRREVSVINNRALNAMRAGDTALAEQLYNEALARARRVGDEHGAAYAHINLGILARQRNDFATASEHYILNLSFCRERRDTLGTALALFNLGFALRHQGEIGGLTLFVAAEEILARLGNQHVERVRSEIASWEAELGSATQLKVDQLRRDFKRRPLSYLRDIPIPEPEVRPLPPRRIALV